YGADRQKIIDETLQGQAILGQGPVLPNSWAFDPAIKQYAYDPAQAERLLDQAGWKDTNNDGVRERGDARLAFTLAVNSDDPTRARVAQQLADDWAKIGAEVEVQLASRSELVQDMLRPRDFDAVLF